MIEIILSFAVICLAVGWIFFPDVGLEPVIALIGAIAAFVPLYIYKLHPKLSAFFMGRSNFQFLSSNKLINAIEGNFESFSNGITLKLKKQSAPNYPVSIRIFFEQTSLWLMAGYKDGAKVNLDLKFSIGYTDDDAEIRLPKQENSYFVAQYDVTGNGIDDIILGVIVPSDIGVSIEILIYEYHPPYKSVDVYRKENWRLFEGFIAVGVYGKATVKLEKNSITIPRNFRDLEYRWTYVDRDIIYTGTA